MAKTIEKILDDFVVPEMEYDTKYDKVKTKSKARANVSVTIDEIPEVVLPKTKAEVYNEARDRLTQKTAAASKKTGGAKRSVKNTDNVKTVELEIAAVSEAAVRQTEVRRPIAEPKWVGGTEELIPFAWRNPLIADIARQSKIYRQAVRVAKESLLPTFREK